MRVDEIAQNFSFMKSLGPPLERNHRSYFNWIWRKKPLGKGYDDYIYHASDFVSLTGKDSNYFEELIRRHITWWRGSPIRVSDLVQLSKDRCMEYDLKNPLTYKFLDMDEDQGQGEAANLGPKCFLLLPFETRGSCSGPDDLHNHRDPSNPCVSFISSSNVASDNSLHLHNLYHPLRSYHDRYS